MVLYKDGPLSLSLHEIESSPLFSEQLLRKDMEDRTALYLMQQQTKGTTLIQDHGFVMV